MTRGVEAVAAAPACVATAATTATSSARSASFTPRSLRRSASASSASAVSATGTSSRNSSRSSNERRTALRRPPRRRRRRAPRAPRAQPRRRSETRRRASPRELPPPRPGRGRAARACRRSGRSATPPAPRPRRAPTAHASLGVVAGDEQRLHRADRPPPRVGRAPASQLSRYRAADRRSHSAAPSRSPAMSSDSPAAHAAFASCTSCRSSSSRVSPAAYRAAARSYRSRQSTRRRLGSGRHGDDDWRITIEVEEEEHATGLLDRLGGDLDEEARELAKELESHRLAVSRDDDTIFVYAATRRRQPSRRTRSSRPSSASTASRRGRARSSTGSTRRTAGTTSRRARRWEEEELDRGYAPWEVRVECPSRQEARRARRAARDGGLQARAPLPVPDRRHREPRGRGRAGEPASTARSRRAARSSCEDDARQSASPSSAAWACRTPTLTNPREEGMLPRCAARPGESEPSAAHLLMDLQHRSVLRICKKRFSSRPAHWRRQTR